MVQKAVEEGLLVAAELGTKIIKVFHLQYADDMIFITLGTLSNSRAMRMILKNFELFSGLKVNFKKYCVLGLMWRSQELSRWHKFWSVQWGLFLVPI